GPSRETAGPGGDDQYWSRGAGIGSPDPGRGDCIGRPGPLPRQGGRQEPGHDRTLANGGAVRAWPGGKDRTAARVSPTRPAAAEPTVRARESLRGETR